MKFPERKLTFLILLGFLCLGGCETTQEARYNYAVHDAPTYDAVVYTPKYSSEFYDHTYYHH